MPRFAHALPIAVALVACAHPPPQQQSPSSPSQPQPPSVEAPRVVPDARANEPIHDVVIRGGTIYDGTGGEPFSGDVAIDGDKIAAVGPILLGKTIVDAHGFVVAPGFVNMLSHAYMSLGRDGRALSDVMQGVTLEVFGETSLHPFGARMQELEQRGLGVNIAGLVATSTVRAQSMSMKQPHPNAIELQHMQKLVAQAMDEGALGLTSALIYTPDNAFSTDELVQLALVAGQHGGIYAAHMRNEGNRLIEAIDEMITIAERAKLPVEIYHFKQSGHDNWDKLDRAVQEIERARQRGLSIGADMYTYDAAATGLDATMPPWVRAGGDRAWIARLKDPAQRERCAREMRRNDGDWDNFLAAAGPDGVMIAQLHAPSLRGYAGKTLAEVAQLRHEPPAETLMDLVIAEGSRGAALYFTIAEKNIARQVQLPWMSFASDADAGSPEHPPRTPAHPRAFGNFARAIGHYARDQKLVSLQEVIRRLTSLPASVLHLEQRGRLVAGSFADVVIFDAQKIQDRATYQDPNQPAIGVRDVFVNGAPVVANGVVTALTPGRFIRRRAP